MSTPIRTAIVIVASAVAIIAGVFAFARPTQATLVVAQAANPTPTPVAVEPVQPAEESPETTDSDSRAGSDANQDATDDLAPTPTTEPTVAPIDDIVAAPECDEPFMMGRWHQGGAGVPGTAMSLSVDTDGVCETVTIGMDSDSPGIEITRIPFLNWTRIRFGTGEVPMLPAPDLVMAGGDLVTGAVAFNDSFGPGVFVSHPSGIEVAAHTMIDGNTVRIDFRESQPGDATVDADYGGEPYSMPMGGSPENGLVVLLATELEGSGEIGIVGYARAPEANVNIRIWDGPILVEHVALIAEGPAYSYSRFSHNSILPNGIYTIEIGWDSPSGLSEFDVWHTTEVQVIGAP